MIQINGKDFDVGVATISRTYTVETRFSHTTDDGIMHREVKGVRPSYSLTFGNISVNDYDALVEEFLRRVEYHTISLPDGKTNIRTIAAFVDSVSDAVLYADDTGVYYDGLSVNFKSNDLIVVD